MSTTATTTTAPKTTGKGETPEAMIERFKKGLGDKATRVATRTEIRQVAEVEGAAKKTAEKAGKEVPATPVIDWMGSADYKNRRDAAAASTTSGGTRSTKVLDADLEARIGKLVKETPTLTRSGVVKAVRASGMSASQDRIGAAFARVTKDRPKQAKPRIAAGPSKAAAKKAPAAKKTTAAKKAPAANKRTVAAKRVTTARVRKAS